MADLRELTIEMDDRIMCVGGTVGTLKDIDILLGKLKEDMHMAQQKGQERAYFEEIFRNIRVLSELMHHTMKECDGAVEDALGIHKKIFDVIVKEVSEAKVS